MFTGSLVAIVTPFNSNGKIDNSSFEKLVSWHLEQGTDGLIVVGTTGESGALLITDAEGLVRRAKQLVGGEIPIIAGAGGTNTEAAIASAKSMQEAGADGLLIMSPAYVKPPQRGIVQHYQAVAEAVPAPILLYNVPGRTASDMLPETVAELAQIQNIIGIKEATGSLDRLKDLQRLCEDDFVFLSGDDETACEFMLKGGHGVISVTANVVPHLMKALCDLCRSKKEHEAIQLNQKLAKLHQSLFLESNPIPTKALMNQMGLISNQLRLPLVPLDEIYEEQLFSAYQEAISQ